MDHPVLILDNGAATLKTGFAHMDTTARLVPNKVARLQVPPRRLYVADELYQCNAWESLHWRVPFERGILTNWDVEKVIWDRIFTDDVLKVDTKGTSLLVTEPPFNLPNVAATYDQMIFEEYEFASYYRCPSAALVPYGTLFGDRMPEVAVVVESGHSFTHIVPILRGEIFLPGIRRIDIGGHLLTNHLKLMLSFRQFEMTDLTWVVEDIKHKLCFVSRHFCEDVEASHKVLLPGSDGKIPPNPLQLSYVLPDLSHEQLGHALPSGQVRSSANPDHPTVHLNSERFSVPELLFRPTNIGLKQAGLPATIAHAIASLPEEVRAMAWANIGLIGGNVLFDGFKERLEDELRTLAPIEAAVGLQRADDPITSTYDSAVRFASSPLYNQKVITKQDYEEIGSAGIRRLLAGEKRSEARRSVPEKVAPEEDESMNDSEEEIPSLKRTKGRGSLSGRGKVGAVPKPVEKPKQVESRGTGRGRGRRLPPPPEVAVESSRGRGASRGRGRGRGRYV